MILSQILFSCELNREFDFLSHQDEIVVNGLLCPDSTISIKLSKTLPYPSSNEQFPIIEDASVFLYENGSFIGELKYAKDKQVYCSQSLPEVGKTYSIKVEVPGYPSLTASTSIPRLVDVSVCYSPFDNDGLRFNGKIFASVNVSNIHKDDRYWLAVISDYYSNTGVVKRKWLNNLYSGSTVFDNFNSLRDGGLAQYFHYLRINESAEDIHDLTVDLFSFETNYFYTYDRIQALGPDQGLYVVVFNGSPEFDYYMKSTVQYFLASNFENTTPNPFVEQVLTYSNVKNGKGIFAGYNQTLIPIHNKPCN